MERSTPENRGVLLRTLINYAEVGATVLTFAVLVAAQKNPWEGEELPKGQEEYDTEQGNRLAEEAKRIRRENEESSGD